jgi:hypothetical protein
MNGFCHFGSRSLGHHSILVMLAAAGSLSTVDCSGHGSCPPHGRMLTGAVCHGEDLQCPYELTIGACDGTSRSIASSCSCKDGHWACPDPGTPQCGAQTGTAGAGNSSATGGSSTATRPAKQLDTSCPYIFAWNGSSYEYQTDIEGEVIGLPPIADVNRGMRLFGSSFIKLPTAVFDSEQGIELRLRETIAEVTYFDQVKLVLVDHPAGYEIWSSSAASTYEWGYVDQFRVHTTKDARPPIAAFDENGNDVLALVSELDNVPVPTSADGLHAYTLDFGPILDPENAKLIVDAWAVYKLPSTHTVQPYVEAEDGNGVWQKVREFGVPAGDLKSIPVDLSNRLPDGVRRLRVNLGTWSPGRMVVDRIRLDESAPVDVTLSYLDPISAELVHRGRATNFYTTLTSRITAVDDEHPDDPAQYAYGAFTRYGDVLELLGAPDDKFAIMRHGDQITVRFAGVPAPPSGWTRSVLLQADVFYKVMLSPDVVYQVEPLPFHGMSQYPYRAPEAYPTDTDHQDYRARYNTRLLPAP